MIISKMPLIGLLTICLLFIGCKEDHRLTISEVSSANQITSAMKDQDPFVLEIMTQGCPYCQAFEAECLDVHTNEDLEIFRLDIKKIDKEEMCKNLNIDSIDFVPVIYWIEDGKIQNEFPVGVVQDQKQLFEKWINDNLSYY